MKQRELIQKAMSNLGVPQPGYPTPVAEAYRLLAEALNTFPSLNEICVEAVNQMVNDGVTKHIQFISAEDDIWFGLKAGGKIPKITIEWVDAQEAAPKNFETA